MARPSTAARRYAEAAFEIGLRDGTVDAWRDELDAAATVVSRPRRCRRPARSVDPDGRA